MIRKFSIALAAAGLIAAAALATSTAPSLATAGEINHIHALPIKGGRVAGVPVSNFAGKPGATKSNGIVYHGGPVMTAATTNAYVIWYGTWATAKQTILEDFLRGIGGTSRFNTNTSYYDGSGRKVVNNVTYAGSTTDSYSQGSSNLSDGAILNIVSSAITGGRLPADANGVYFVFTSSDVSKSGFLTNYCGWHTYATISSTNIKYSFVGDPTGASVGSCAGQTTNSPNGDVGADAMVSVITHELEEAVTDPNLNAWYDNRGYENSDKCAWTWGTTYTTSNGAKANVKIGSRDFLVQRNWVNASGGYCSMSY